MRFDFVQNRFMYYGVALALVVISLVAYLTLPLNLGIDMTGGTQAEYDYVGNVNMEQVKTIVADAKKSTVSNGVEVVNNTNVYRVSGEDKFVVEAGFSKSANMTDKDLEAAKTGFKDKITDSLTKMNAGGQITLSRYINVGESFGDYIKKTAYLTLAFVIIAISLYIAYAFRGSIEGFSSFSFAVVTAVSLFHDVVIAFGFYLIASHFFPEFKVDTFFITAMLTVLGYSINDTIVVMDRIRSNLRLPENKKKDFGVVINNSVNDTMTRSLYTSFTIFITLVAMFFFGPESIKGFILALLFGTVVGAYSSIAIAAPLLYDISGKRK